MNSGSTTPKCWRGAPQIQQANQVGGVNTGWRLEALEEAVRADVGISVERKAMPAHWDWSLDAPVALKVPVRAFDWKPTDAQALPGKPVTGTASETVRLVPYGCTKFRVSMFPVTDRAWLAPSQSEAK